MGGHGTVPKEHNTQQSPGFARRSCPSAGALVKNGTWAWVPAVHAGRADIATRTNVTPTSAASATPAAPPADRRRRQPDTPRRRHPAAARSRCPAGRFREAPRRRPLKRPARRRTTPGGCPPASASPARRRVEPRPPSQIEPRQQRGRLAVGIQRTDGGHSFLEQARCRRASRSKFAGAKTDSASCCFAARMVGASRLSVIPALIALLGAPWMDRHSSPKSLQLKG